ncbi:conjugal transfer protein TraF [Candidatus Odyssella thessalonicensis]|uniref:conjugal transfer protein TraF n=1 Tax=Candidatus Odyssella thessalonicensis TaxID=84647 RepID=UPI000225ACEA|nr:conjugal transfer protein TraF [Candidatus Odyssella thessalonicensis]
MKHIGRFFFFMLSLSHAKTFYQDHARGWHWYEKMPVPEDPKSKNNPVAEPKTPAEKMKAYREELENRLADAWLNPTPQNVSKYQEMQQDMMNRSQTFSQTWMKNVYTNASLDHTLIAPVNQKAVHVYLDQEKERKKEVIKSLSTTHGLFFFYASNCPYCHQFAPIVKRFAEHYGWEVLAISLDGGPIETFPDAVPDNGLASQWHVTALPSLYAVNPETEAVVQVAHGLASLDEMENRIMVLTRGDQ